MMASDAIHFLSFLWWHKSVILPADCGGSHRGAPGPTASASCKELVRKVASEPAPRPKVLDILEVVPRHLCCDKFSMCSHGFSLAFEKQLARVTSASLGGVECGDRSMLSSFLHLWTNSVAVIPEIRVLSFQLGVAWNENISSCVLGNIERHCVQLPSPGTSTRCALSRCSTTKGDGAC